MFGYKTGYAKYAHQSESPEEWRGLIGAFCPYLGPTGNQVFDFSRVREHGTLSGLSAADDWIADEGGYGLYFDGTSDHIDIGTGRLPNTADFTLTSWVKHDNTGNTNSVLFAQTSADFIFSSNSQFGGASDQIRLVMDAEILVGPSINDGIWHHVVLTRKVNTYDLYVDGLFNTTGTSARNPGTGTSYIGQRVDGGSTQSHLGLLDDIRIYDRVLSDGLIKQMYENGRASMFVPTEAVFDAGIGLSSGGDGLRTLALTGVGL